MQISDELDATFSLRSARGLGILTALIFASSSAFLLGSALGVALPAIQAGFAADLSSVQWVMNAHLLVESALLPASGALADIYGRRRIFLLGIVLFSLGGVLSAIVPGIPYLVAAQAGQGLGGALMIPGSLALIQTHFRETDRGLAIGIWAGVSAATAACGPPLGGLLVATAGWRWIFALVIVPGTLAALATYLAVPVSRRSADRARPDWTGIALLFTGLFAGTYALIFAPARGWTSPTIEGAAMISIAALVVFVAWQIHAGRAGGHPMIPARLFEQRDVIGANLLTICLYFGLSGTTTYTIFYLQQIQSFSPQAVGLALLPMIVVIAVLSGPGGLLADRYGLKHALMFGTFLAGLGMFWIAVTIFMSPVLSNDAAGFAGGRWRFYAYHYLPGLILLGVGMAGVISPVSRAALRVAGDLTGTASGVNNAASRIASLFAIALPGAILTGAFLHTFAPALGALNLAPDYIAWLLGEQHKLGAIRIPEHLDPAQHEQVRATIAFAFHRGYVLVLAVCGALAWISTLIAGVFIARR